MDTYTHILDLSESLIKRSGYNGFSYADIARALDISKPSVHHHFPTKAALALASVERYRARFGAALASIDAQHVDVDGALTQLAELFSQSFQGVGNGCLCASLTADWTSLPDEVRAGVTLYWEQTQAWIATHITRHNPKITPQAASEMASLVFSLYEGAMMSARVCDDPDIFARAARAAITLVGTHH